MKDSTNIPALGLYLSSFQRKVLQQSLQESLPENHRQRILIMLLADEGKTQKEICQTLNCSNNTVRHWILMAQNGMALQWQQYSPGRPKIVKDEYIERLKELVGKSPRNSGYFCQKWTASLLSKHLAKEFGIKINERNIHRLLKQMGLSTRSNVTNSHNSLNKPKQARILIQDLYITPVNDN